MAKRAGVVSVDVEPNLSQVGSKIDAVSRLLKPLGLRVNLDNDFTREIERGVGSSRRSLDSISTTKAQGELRQLGTVGERELGRVGGGAKLSASALLTVGAGAVAVGSKIIGGLRPAADAASDLNEAISYSQQVFGESAGAIDRWSDSSATALGQSKRQAIEGATTFATFGKAAGLAGQDLVGFSTDLVKLATDLASAKNTSPEEAVTAIGAALRGESEPIRQYGVLLDDATLRQEAFALGLTKTTKDALTPQQKVLAAQSAIFKQTSDAQGDFARTADGAANSQRVAAAEFENAKAKLGEGLTPVIVAGTKALSGFLSVLDKIPGGTTALGVGLFSAGALSVIGGGVTSMIGLKRAIDGVRASAVTTAPAVAEVGVAAEVSGATGATAFGRLGGAMKVAGGVLAAVGFVQAIFEVTNALRDLDGQSQKAMTGFAANVNDGREAILTSFEDLARIEDQSVGFGDIIKSFGTEFSFAGVTGVRDIEYFQQAFDKISTTQPVSEVQKFIDAARDQNEQLDHSSTNYTETKKLLDEWQKSVDNSAKAQKNQANATSTQTEALDQFGYAIDAAKSKNEQYADSLQQAFAPIEAAVNAQEALSDGQKTLADAQKKYQDIISGNTDGMKSAAEALRSARDELDKAISKTGPGSEAAKDAAHSLRDALRALHEAEVEAGKDSTKEGDFFEDKRQAVLDAFEKVIDAQKKLDEINAGKSDEVASARDRVADAQRRYNEELAKTGPNSQEAQDALEAVSDAERAIPGLVVDVEVAQANLRDELDKHPGAIQASIDKIDEWQRRGLISVAVAEAWKKELLLVAAASQQINASTPQPLDNAPPENRPGGPLHTPTGTPSPSPSAPTGAKREINDRQRIDEGWGPRSTPKDGATATDKAGHEWTYHRNTNTWTAQFHDGGLVGPDGGEVHDGEIVVKRSSVQKYGAANVLAINEGTARLARVGGNATFAAPDQPSAGPPAVTAAAPSTVDLVAEMRGLRGDMAALYAFLMRQASVGGGSETLAPLLQEGNDLLRRMGAGGFPSPADIRRGAVAFA